MSHFSWPQGLQHARLPSSTISWSLLKFMFIESVMLFNHLILCRPFSFCLQTFPASMSFPMSQLFASGGQSIGTSATVLPMNIQDWLPLKLTGLISLLFKGPSRVFSSTTVWKNQFFGSQPSLWSSSHICTWLLEKPQLWLHGPSRCGCRFLCLDLGSSSGLCPDPAHSSEHKQQCLVFPGCASYLAVCSMLLCIVWFIFRQCQKRML